MPRRSAGIFSPARRVREVAALAMVVAAIEAPGLCQAEISFEHSTLDSGGPTEIHVKAAGDLDGDTFVDLLIAGTDGTIEWYEYPEWTRHTITTGGDGGWSCDAEVADVDRDGDQDVIISDWYLSGRLVWFENPRVSGDPGAPEWTFHLIGSPQAHDIEVADLDRDGDLDVATRQQGADGDEIVLWRQDDPYTWTRRLIGSYPGEGLHLGDLDRDGDSDVIIGGVWYENTGDIVSGPWTERSFSPGWDYPHTFPWLGDINGDARPDVVLTPTEFQGGTFRTSWYEAPADPRTGVWMEHVIDQGIETVTHSLGLGDMNNDGFLDVITAEMQQGDDPDEVRIYINESGDGLSWTKHVIDTNGSHDLRVIDIGRDGDLDIFGANWSGTQTVDLWVNLARSSADNSQPGRSDGLRVRKNANGSDLDLVWNPPASCAGATDYGVYEGNLGDWSGTHSTRCSTGGLPSATITPAQGNLFFLVVPNTPDREGSYGTNSAGVERPAAANACRAVQDTTSCP